MGVGTCSTRNFNYFSLPPSPTPPPPTHTHTRCQPPLSAQRLHGLLWVPYLTRRSRFIRHSVAVAPSSRRSAHSAWQILTRRSSPRLPTPSFISPFFFSTPSTLFFCCVFAPSIFRSFLTFHFPPSMPLTFSLQLRSEFVCLFVYFINTVAQSP